jgi:D-alanyl-lipoteichoic acid acyltransferase DltB (MBOAT superfamily)
MQVGFSDLLVRNLVGAVEAWAIIFALTTIGQVFVYDMGFHKKCQVFVFYISALLILGGLVVWNQAGHANFEEQIGFLFTSVVLLILTLLNVQKTSNIDASNILK